MGTKYEALFSNGLITIPELMGSVVWYQHVAESGNSEI